MEMEKKMKKYVKPDFYYENFQLSNYASACGIPVESNTSTDNSCGYTLPGGIQIFMSVETCGSVNESYCSQNGGADFSVMWS